MNRVQFFFEEILSSSEEDKQRLVNDIKVEEAMLKLIVEGQTTEKQQFQIYIRLTLLSFLLLLLSDSDALSKHERYSQFVRSMERLHFERRLADFHVCHIENEYMSCSNFVESSIVYYVLGEFYTQVDQSYNHCYWSPKLGKRFLHFVVTFWEQISFETFFQTQVFSNALKDISSALTLNLNASCKAELYFKRFKIETISTKICWQNALSNINEALRYKICKEYLVERVHVYKIGFHDREKAFYDATRALQESNCLPESNKHRQCFHAEIILCKLYTDWNEHYLVQKVTKGSMYNEDQFISNYPTNFIEHTQDLDYFQDVIGSQFL